MVQSGQTQLAVKNFLSAGSLPVDYQSAWQAMRDFTRTRTNSTADELWIMEHSPVYTLGQAGDRAHILNAGDIPVIKIDRGGQVTYHGPGQLMFYYLANLTRLQISVRALVEKLESAVIQMLADYGIQAEGDRQAPGVYVDGKKIAALGLRISRGCCYHGLCFNYHFDAAPFAGINPCGYEDMQVTQLAELMSDLPDKNQLIGALIKRFCEQIGCEANTINYEQWP